MATRAKKWYKPFLAELAKHANVSAACSSAGISRATVYAAYKSDKSFAARWDEALETALDAKKWYKPFLAELAKHANVSAACSSAGISRTTVYNSYKSDERFAVKWKEAVDTAIDAIELAVYNASLKGDAPTARWFLSRRRPEIWGDRIAVSAEVSGQLELTATVAESMKAKILTMAEQMAEEETENGVGVSD